MRPAVWLALKDLRLLSRDRMALFWVVAFPLLFALLFGVVIESSLSSRFEAIEVLVVDEDRSPRSALLVRSLSKARQLELRPAALDEAERSVKRGDAAAHLWIPAGYGANVSERLPVLSSDRSRPAEAAVLAGVVERVVAQAAGSDTRTAPVLRVAAIEGRSRSGFELAFPAAVLWALMGCAATFAISMVAERTGGTLLRLRAAPISRASIAGGKAMACFVACAVDALLLVLAAHALFDLRIDSLLALLASVASASLCFAGLTLTLGMMGRSEQATAGAGWAALIVMAMLGGAMVPLSVMPDWLRGLSDYSPVKWGIVALEGAIWRDFSALELLWPCATLIAIGAASFALGLLLLRPERAR